MIFMQVIIGVLAAAWMAGATDNGSEPIVGQETGPVAEQAPDEPEISIEGNTLTESTKPVFFESYAGDFNIRFPGGCAKTRERIPVDDNPDVEKNHLQIATHVFCDRQGYSGEGCSVTAYVDDDLNAEPSADVSFVTRRVQAVLAKFGSKVIDQKPFHEIIEGGPRMEGLDVLASGPENKGQIWVRGLLVEGDVYILTAWRSQGQLALDPEFTAFFDSFRPHGSS
ncbi:MAG: hypothetical protein KOO60_02770 [Gemmatimonadales bacterium]|nr:hypothetical protein [Gemmatimonadales bacterium]